jgi:hypothetical protein
MLGIELVPVTVIVIKAEIVLVRINKMGFRKPMDYNQVSHQIYMTGVELNSRYNDGFTQSLMKQDLYKLKWLIDEIIADSPTFSDEEQFLKENEQRVMWRTLKK